MINLEVAYGETIRLVLTLADGDGVAVDLTGATDLISHLRTPDLVLISEGDVAVTDDVGGEITIVFSATDTGATTASVGIFDLFATLAGGDRRRLAAGKVSFVRAVSRA